MDIVQVDHGGQRLHFVDYNFQAPQCCPTALLSLPNLQLSKQNRVDSEWNNQIRQQILV